MKDHTIQGWTMDKERLKKGHMFTDEYFERQLQYIREIRLAERKFDQKVTDFYATDFDYDKDARTTRLFFQTVQNKLHYAVHRHTAAELIVERADALIVKVVVSKKLNALVSICPSCLSGFTMTRISCK